MNYSLLYDFNSVSREGFAFYKNVFQEVISNTKCQQATATFAATVFINELKLLLLSRLTFNVFQKLGKSTENFNN